MKKSISLYLNNCVYEIPCSRKFLIKIPESKEEIFNVLISNHQYFVRSKVRNEIFQSFLKYWKDDTFPQVDSTNIMEYYQLSSEFGLMNDYFQTQQGKDPLFNLNFLIGLGQNTNEFKDSIEKNISLNLDDYLNNFSDKLALINISSLYNIFFHPERKLEDHDKAYHFIINAASNYNKNLFVLLKSLDGQKLKEKENKSDMFLKIDDHFSFYPQNAGIVFSELMQKNENLNKQLSDSKMQNENLNKQLSDSKTQNENLNKQLSDSKMQNENLNKQLSDSKMQNENLNKQLNDSKMQNENLNKQLNDSKMQNENLNKQLSDSKMQNENLNKQLSDSKTQNENLSKQLSDSKMQNDDLNKQLKFSCKPQIFNYTGKVQSAKLIAGTYKLEVWGAQGGSYDTQYYGGKGGYSTGNLTLHDDTTLYIYVGGQGDNCNVGKNGGWNGGGSINHSYGICEYGGGGGGATDISLYGTDGSSDWNNTQHLYSRIIVAGGGSSASHGSGGGDKCGGFGGGESGGGSLPASQTSAGTNGKFGVGANEEGSGGSPDGAAGGGWYGGGAYGLRNYYKPSGGGSGYVYTSSTKSNYPSGCLLNSSHFLDNASTCAGNKSFPNVEGNGDETGHSGNGAVKITLVS